MRSPAYVAGNHLIPVTLTHRLPAPRTHRTLAHMNALSITLPDTLHTFAQQQEREALRVLLLDGAASSPTAPVDAAYFERLRAQVHHHAAANAPQ